jgi:nicotinate dehydrogenase subunit A
MSESTFGTPGTPMFSPLESMLDAFVCVRCCREALSMPVQYTVDVMVNGQQVQVTGADDTEDLLYVLRNQLRLKGPKFGCGLAQCGACTVLVNGKVTRSCVTKISAVAGATVTTLEGIGTPEQPHPMQAAFIQQQAGQCAYCANAMIMGTVGWLQARKMLG